MSRFWRHMAIGLLLLATVGCAGKQAELSLVPDMDRVWPVPPDIPRIAYMDQMRTPADAGVRDSVLQRIVGLVAGRQEPPKIETPVGIYADASGHVLVADVDLQVVHIFNLSKGTYAQAFNLPDGSRLASPVGVAYDPERGWVFVSDSIKNRIFVYDERGYYVGMFGDGLKRVAGLAWDPLRKRLIAADTGNHRVLIFDADGVQTAQIGRRGQKIGEFNFPTHVAVDGNGDFYVTDSLNFRVQKFAADNTPIAILGGLGRVLGSFSKPKGVAVDPDGRVFVVDGIFDVVQLFDREGRLLMHFGGSGSGPGQFWLPAGIAVAGNNIFVADTRNGRVQIFRLLNTADVPSPETDKQG